MQGLPASMKKLRVLSMDKSRHSINDIDKAFEEEKDTEEVDMKLKFFNKQTIKSLRSQKASKHQKSSSHAVIPNRRSRFKSRKYLIKHIHSQTPDVKIKPNKASNKNGLFHSPSEVFYDGKQIGKHEKPILQYNQPIDYLDNGIGSQMMCETLSQMISEKRQEIYPIDEPNYQNSHVGNIESNIVRRQQQELELERMRLERSENLKQNQISTEAQISTIDNNFIPKRFGSQNQIMANRSRSQNQNYVQSQPQDTLPPINHCRNNNGSKFVIFIFLHRIN